MEACAAASKTGVFNLSMSCIASFPSKLPDARCGVERLLAPNVPHLSPVCGYVQVRERGVFACICVSILCRHLSLGCFFFNIMREQAQMRDPLCVYMSERLRGFRTSQGTSVPTYRSFHFADHFRIGAIEFVHLHTSRCTRMLSKHHEACRHGNPFRLRTTTYIHTHAERRCSTPIQLVMISSIPFHLLPKNLLPLTSILSQTRDQYHVHHTESPSGSCAYAHAPTRQTRPCPNFLFPRPPDLGTPLRVLRTF